MKKYLTVLIIALSCFILYSCAALAQFPEADDSDYYEIAEQNFKVLDSAGRSLKMDSNFPEAQINLYLLPEQENSTVFLNGRQDISLPLNHFYYKMTDANGICIPIYPNGEGKCYFASPKDPKYTAKINYKLSACPPSYELDMSRAAVTHAGGPDSKVILHLTSQQRYKWEYVLAVVCFAAFMFLSFYVSENSVKRVTASKVRNDADLSDAPKISKINSSKIVSLFLFILMSVASLVCAGLFPWVSHPYIPFFGLVIFYSLPFVVFLITYFVCNSINKSILLSN